MDKTLAKGLDIVEMLARHESPMSVSEVALARGLTRSNAHRVLATLGYVTQDAQTRRYALTLKLWTLGALIIARLDLKSVATPFLHELNEVTGETTHLSLRDGSEIMYIDKLEAKHVVRTFTRIGGKAPAYCVATGRAMLAFQDRPTIDHACEEAVGFTPATITDPIALRDELHRTRERGYAVNRGEWRGGAYGLAVPIRNVHGRVDAAIGISAPRERLPETRIAELVPTLKRLGEDMSRALGYTGNTP